MDQTATSVGVHGNVKARQLITSPMIRSIFGTELLGQAHPSLNNIDKLRYHVAKWQSRKTPFGTDVLGVVFDFWRNPDLRDYIRRLEVLADGRIFFVAMSRQQAEDITNLPGFEVDMSFKGTAGDVNEWEIAYFHPTMRLTLTFARIFTNSSTADAYCQIFDAVADTIKEHTGKYPNWRHIHGEGWAYVQADLDVAQAKGLGMHLEKIDSTKNAEEHLQHVLIACITHYGRKLDEKHFPQEVKRLMASIPYLEDSVAIDHAIADLMGRQEKEIHDWLDFYLRPWVLSSLSPVYTKVPHDIFSSLSRTTNASESNHANANRDGKKMNLLETIYT